LLHRFLLGTVAVEQLNVRRHIHCSLSSVLSTHGYRSLRLPIRRLGTCLLSILTSANDLLMSREHPLISTCLHVENFQTPSFVVLRLHSYINRRKIIAASFSDLHYTSMSLDGCLMGMASFNALCSFDRLHIMSFSPHFLLPTYCVLVIFTDIYINLI